MKGAADDEQNDLDQFIADLLLKGIENIQRACRYPRGRQQVADTMRSLLLQGWEVFRVGLNYSKIRKQMIETIRELIVQGLELQELTPNPKRHDVEAAGQSREISLKPHVPRKLGGQIDSLMKRFNGPPPGFPKACNICNIHPPATAVRKVVKTRRAAGKVIKTRGAAGKVIKTRGAAGKKVKTRLEEKMVARKKKEEEKKDD